MFCVGQSFNSLIHVMVEICYVVVNVIIFKICERIFTLHGDILNMSEISHVFPTIGMCMIYEKKKSLSAHDKQPRVPV